MKNEFQFRYKNGDTYYTAKVEGDKVVVDSDELKDKSKSPFFTKKHAQKQIDDGTWVLKN